MPVRFGFDSAMSYFNMSLVTIGRLMLIPVILAVFIGLSWASEIKVIYPDREAIDDKSTYPYALLELALQKSQKAYRLIPSRLPMTDARARVELSRKRISIAWFGTSTTFEHQFRTIRFPITQGLLGHRLLVIHKDDQEQFSRIRTLEDLKNLSAGQGIGWADVEILKHAGLNVKTDMVDDLFLMINRHQIIDYFPLGVNEIFNFVANKISRFPHLAVEKNLVLVYPFDFFFFVNIDNKQLHDIVYQGLLQAHADGSFDRLFTSHPDHSGFLNKAELKRRHKISIDNPVLSKETNDLLKKFSYTR